MGLVFSLVGCGDDGNGSAGSGGSGGGTATVSGTVYAASLDNTVTTVAGATVLVVGGPSTTSGSDGSFSLEAPVGTGMWLTTAPDAWGELLTADVPAAGFDMADPEVIPDALVAEIAAGLMETFDPAKGMVTVEFDVDVAVGGETADLGVNYDFAFVFDDEGNPVLDNELVAGADPIVIFANVDIVGDVMPSATAPGGGDCPGEFPGVAYPSQAKVFTVVDVACP